MARITRTPVRIIWREEAIFKDTYGGDVGVVAIGGMHFTDGNPSDTVLLTMHPIGGTQGVPVMPRLAEAGLHVLAMDSRYRGVDYALIMEKVALDLGAAVRYAREKLGYKKVIMLGWSGGGSLSAFYQAQAENPTVTDSPGGGGPDLTKAGLIPGDGVIEIAAHVSRHGTLTEWIDASILDEANPDIRDPELDLYGDLVKPPYTPEFIERYRAAQLARNHRITAWVKEKLAHLRATGRENEEFAFATHGTMADPRWLDPAIDPNDRKANWCYMGDPRIVNMSPVGLARFSTLRSWLSQWSHSDANADGLRSLATVSKPVLVMNNTADDACTPSHSQRLFDAVAHDRKKLVHIKGATHYYQDQPELAQQAAQTIRTWLTENDLLA
ncbi:alpha/beta hydrolase [uncultured Sphingomonas sp.]|uniref:alpha/beta hydrolase n=1 Tax=uncultured Sphingomonas sp. TaxID=158754 RepID=UPI002603E247|nr:alpha/beta hydrolase [uncultured Sphingomonas sp.]